MSEEQEIPQRSRPNHGQRLLRVIAISLLFLAIASWLYLLLVAKNTPVPRSIQQEVSFKVYYTKQSAMPTGYRLDKESFRMAQPGVVLFSVSYGNGRSMVFSEEAKPAGDTIDKFNTSAIPVHTQVGTPIGTALVGAYGSGKDLRTIASLPIKNGPWLIVTAPSDINQADLGKILSSLTK